MASKTSDETKEEMIYEATNLPDFEGRKVFVLPGAFFASCVRMMAEAGFERADSVDEADLVVFIGGVDVNPELYGQEKLPQTQALNKARDDYEKEVYDKCIRRGTPMFGICRGAQFLHVMNGGQLWQDVEGHGGEDHWIYDREEDVYVLANSYHHQMLALSLDSKLEVLAVCKDQISKTFKSSDLIINVDTTKPGDEGREVEIEAGYYSDTKCFFVQGHPEVSSPEFRSWCLHKLNDFVLDMETAPEAQETLNTWRRAALM